MTSANERVGLSTISFRFRPLPEALEIIARLGAVEVDLGAIPDVTDHVPVPFTGDVDRYVDELAAHGLRCGAVNADVGDLNDPSLDAEMLRRTALPLLELASATGAALVVACGRADREPFVDEESDLSCIGQNLRLLADLARPLRVRLLAEVLHHRRFIHSTRQADLLLARVPSEEVGLLLDVAHVVASAEDPAEWARGCHDRVERVHLRDAVPGDLNIGIGRGAVDFAEVIQVLEESGFAGSYILELETHDVQEADREADALRSRDQIVELLEPFTNRK
ncbi:sugar phosphate isomerase/epimerase [Luteococcus peritonei]|uniref:Sugar phosphate isomerase/epimerase n=1 Tax=Luteococcus peritonei TaxID=88874 RepID=A0ABW4RW95_9ACTN